MKLKALKIGNLTAPIPIVQGAMAVRISTAPLAAAVAQQGGIGVIAGTGMRIDELRREIRKAREMAKGIIGVNVLFAVREFAKLVLAAIEEGIDLVFSGAGFSRDMFSWGRDKNVPIVPIVSSDRLAKLAEKMGASAVVVEGKEAGGHLGTERSVWDIIPEVKGAVKIPVIAAGGIIEGRDVVEAVKLGADGVQMGTRFAASVESNASEAFKKLYVDSKREDVVLIKSPVGLPGRGLRSPFIDRLESDLGLPIENCVGCLKRCSRDFCIMDALVNACRDGDFNKALIFSGENVYKISEILPVKEIFRRLLKEIESC
ncbi:Nitronate monooxygenase [Koleobacter methoxysyntrophicus]|uniref:Probable nitronate monooxygenase n=1 Tax=Koleobacter methoxysyntrophicus TaxID=2751313 RepID=A0A8A0RPY9_9FIRM|nr:nitronate monooxygenase [Koleobacter methoxysyntrophicus]QSQ10441.1 Nitronate monooxygenase [Koleobacter methoxysyntrophicus]